MLKSRFGLLCGLAILVTFVSACNKQSKEQKINVTGTLYPARQNGKFGYINKTGEFKISPQFDAASSFSEGLASVKVGDKWGFVDVNGKMIINPQFEGWQDINDAPPRFAEGLAAVVSGGKYGYVDPAGKMVISPQFDWANKFSEGLAVIAVGDKYGYIDKTGQLVIKPQYLAANSFSENLAFVAMASGKPSVTGLANSTPVYETTGSGKYSFIDKTGKEVFSYKPAEMTFVFSGRRQIDAFDTAFSEGLVVMPISCAQSNDFTNPMESSICKHGYLDKTGKLVINSEFEMAGSFADGLANVRAGHKWGYIDKSGKVVINPQFDEAGQFSEGLASVKIDGKYGYLDKTGKMMITPQFSSASDFSNGLAQVVTADKVGYVDSTGKFVYSGPIEKPSPVPPAK